MPLKPNKQQYTNYHYVDRQSIFPVSGQHNKTIEQNAAVAVKASRPDKTIHHTYFYLLPDSSSQIFYTLLQSQPQPTHLLERT